MKRLELATLFVLGLIWGSSFLFIKVAVADIPPFTLVFCRLLLAAAALALTLRVRGVRFPRPGRVWLLYLAMGLLNGAVPYTLISAGQRWIDSGLAAILNAAMPVFTVVFAHFWVEGERLSWQRLLGVLVGLAGVVVLIGPEALSGLGRNFRAQLAVVGGGVSYAAAAVVGRRHLRGQPPLVSAAGQMAAGALLMAPFSLLVDAPWTLAPSAVAVASLAALSLLGTALAYILYYFLLDRAGATATSLVTYLIPVMGVLWGVLLLGERLPWRALAALALILAGVAVAGRRRPVS